MLVGIYLKNYKCYQGTLYVPIFTDSQANFSAYLGDNGVGKSAILEGLDAFFSKNPRWLRNKESKKGSSDCFVAPVFKLNKRALKSEFDKVPLFVANLANITINEEDESLVCIARREDGIYSFYDGKKEHDGDEHQKNAQEIYKKITANYSYIYVDAEVNIDEGVKINSEIYELIIGSSIALEIEETIREADKATSFIKDLNNTLESLIDEKFTSNLKKIDDNYSYCGSKGVTSKLTAKILAKTSTESFLQFRGLKLNNKKIEDLSSGQRRVVLLDFILAVLEDGVLKNNKEIILAIDEPEISLDAVKRISQFEKLQKISSLGVSVIFTSHWYGWMATTNIGISYLVEEHQKGDRTFKDYVNAEFPYRDVTKFEMKMIFDFLMSLGAMASLDKKSRFIICEGETDKIYLEASLDVARYKIIPVGKKNVIRLANIFREYYWKAASPTIGNVLFITDTDPDQRDKFDEKNFYLKRWSKDNMLNISLETGCVNDFTKCAIEDVLESQLYLNAIQATMPNEQLVQSLKIKHAKVSGYEAFGLDSVEKMQFMQLTNQNKLTISKKYSELFARGSKNQLRKLVDSSFE